jgi:hypothetical protein
MRATYTRTAGVRHLFAAYEARKHRINTKMITAAMAANTDLRAHR